MQTVRGIGANRREWEGWRGKKTERETLCHINQSTLQGKGKFNTNEEKDTVTGTEALILTGVPGKPGPVPAVSEREDSWTDGGLC